MYEIDALDRALKRSGQPITLRKINGTAGLNNVDVNCLALVRGYTPGELVGDIKQQDSFVVLSPTSINIAGWPGVQVDGKADIRIPSKARGDIAIIVNVLRSVQAAVGIYIGTTLVRIEMQVR